METLDRVLDRLSKASIAIAIAICPSTSAHWIEDVAAESGACADSRRRLAWSLGGLLYSMRLAFPALLLDLWKHRGCVSSLASSALFSWLFLLIPCYFVAAALLDASDILHWPFAPIEAFVASDTLRPWFNAISPIVLLGSLALSVYISLLSVIRAREFRATRGGETSVHAMNIGALVTAVTLMAALVVYACFENRVFPFEAITFA